MNRLWRALRARPALHVALGGLVAVLVAEVLLAPRIGSSSGVPTLLALPVLLLALFALPVAGAELAATRRVELAVARLRGVRGWGYARLVAGEPLLTIVLGAVVGLVVSLGVAAPRSAAGWASLAVLVVGALALVVAGSWGRLREPLGSALQQPAPRTRPGRAGPMDTVLTALVFAGALVAVYDGLWGGSGAGWLRFAAPALIGLAAGQVAVWVVRGLARLLTLYPGGLAWGLAARRLARTDTGLGAVRLLVAAGVTAVVALTGLRAAHDWVQDVGRIEAGAPVVMPFDGDGDQVLAATRRADPDGRWLMAGVRLFSDPRAQSRQALLDTSRYPRVVGDFLAGTEAAAGSRAVAGLAAAGDTGTGTTTTTRRWSMTAVGEASADRALVTVWVSYRGDNGSAQLSTDLVVAPRGSVRRTGHLADCRRGCEVTGLQVEQAPYCRGGSVAGGDCPRPRFRFSRFDLGGVDLVGLPWTVVPRDDGERSGSARQTPRGLRIRLDRDGHLELDLGTSTLVPALVTRGIDWGDDGPSVRDPGGDQLAAHVLASYDALPLVGAAGSVTDLPSLLAHSAPLVPAGEAIVLARSDTPPQVLAALTRLGAGPPVGYQEVASQVAATAHADRARGYALLALGCLLVGPLVALLSFSRVRTERDHEHAALRLLRVPVTALRRATWWELAFLAGIAAAAVLVGGVLAVSALLPGLRLLSVGTDQPPVDTGWDWPVLAACTVGTAILVVGVGVLARRVDAVRTAPALLREAES